MIAPRFLATIAIGLALAGNTAIAATPALASHAVMTEANAYQAPLMRDKTVLLIVDQQVGLLSGVRDTSVSQLKHNVVALVKAAKVMGIPIVVTETMPNGMWGPIFPELKNELGNIPVIERSLINAWDDPKVRAAIEKTGRKQILVAGVSLEVCATFPALSAKAAGYDSRVVLDASGTFNQAKRETGVQRLLGAGVPVVDYATAAVEWLHDNADPKAAALYSALDMENAVLVWQMHQGQKN